MTDVAVVVREPGRTPLHLLIHEPLELGRDCSGLLLDDPQVSRRHLQLRPTPEGLVATDLGSTNGSTLDGEPLVGSTPLTPGSTVRLGDTTVEILAASGGGARPLTVARSTGPMTSIDRVAAAVESERPLPPEAELRDGTITIVFTDIESSTERAREQGDRRWFEILEAHNEVIRRRLAAYRGTEVKSMGDGFMLTFGSAGRAVACMVAVQRDLAEQGADDPGQAVRIRVGAHTGEATFAADGDLFGHHVNFAARVAGQATGGEILVSTLLRELVEPRGGVRFGEPRRAELKGLAGTMLLHPVLWSESDD